MPRQMVDVFGTVAVNAEEAREIPLLGIQGHDEWFQPGSGVRDREIRGGRRFADATGLAVSTVCQHITIINPLVYITSWFNQLVEPIGTIDWLYRLLH